MKLTENIYLQIIENSGEGIWIIDELNNTLYANKTMAQMLGLSLEELKNRSISDFLYEEDIEAFNKHQRDRKEGVTVNDVEWRFLRADKEPLWAMISANPLYDENGTYFGAIGQFRDITLRKKHQTILSSMNNAYECLSKGGSIDDALTELLRPIENLIDGVASSVLLLDDEGKYISCGISPSLPQEYINQLVGLEIGPTFGSCGTAAYTKKMVVVSDIENDILWKNYRKLAEPYGLRACWSNPILSTKGKVLGTFAMYFRKVREPNEFEKTVVQEMTISSSFVIEYMKLISDVKKHLLNEKRHIKEVSLIAKASKKASSSIEYMEVMKKIPEYIVDGFADLCYIALTNDDGKLFALTVAVTEELKEFLHAFENYKTNPESPHGLPQAIREGKSILYETIRDEDLDLTKTEWPKLGTKDPEYVEIVRKLGLKSYMAIPMIVRGKPLGGMIIASFKDGRHYTSNDLKLMDEIGRVCAVAMDNALLYRDAKRAIQNREDFIAIASHELRTPLTSLQIRIDFLLRQIDKINLPDELKDKLTPVIAGIKPDINKFTKLINNLLDVSKFRAHKMSLTFEKVNISNIVRDEVLLIQNQFLEKNVPLEIDIQDDIFGKIDSLRIQQVITNLLTNALKFSNKKPVKFTLTSDTKNIHISVIDQGLGIPPEDLERIFKPFERAVSKGHYGGLGLGLYICKQIIEAHEGNISVQSKLNEGTTFNLVLPLRK